MNLKNLKNTFSKAASKLKNLVQMPQDSYQWNDALATIVLTTGLWNCAPNNFIAGIFTSIYTTAAIYKIHSSQKDARKSKQQANGALTMVLTPTIDTLMNAFNYTTEAIEVANSTAKISTKAGIKSPDIMLTNDNAPIAAASYNEIRIHTELMNERYISEETRDAALAHEISHIKSSDRMKRQVQVILAELILKTALATAVLNSHSISSFCTTILFGLTALPITHYCSRQQELSADEQACKLTGSTQPLIKFFTETSNQPTQTIWSTHPSDGNRIEALKNLASKHPELA